MSKVFRAEWPAQHRRVAQEAVELESDLVGDYPHLRFFEDMPYELHALLVFGAVEIHRVEEDVAASVYGKSICSFCMDTSIVNVLFCLTCSV